MKLAGLGIVALVPMILGVQPAPAHGGRELVTSLCGGNGEMIRLPGGRYPADRPCSIKGCHAGCNRKQFDPQR